MLKKLNSHSPPQSNVVNNDETNEAVCEDVLVYNLLLDDGMQ